MLELKSVSKFYYNKGIVSSGINKVNLKFDMGEFVAITGESGSGKSTLLNVLSGLDTYEEGEMYINGEETSHYTEVDYEEYRKKYIGNIFQNFNLVSSYTVYQNVELVLLINGETRKSVKSKVIEILKKVDLYKYRHLRVSKLSGGMKQRVVIAMALACNPDLLLADEPTTALDVTIQAQVLDMINQLKEDYNTAMIMITHDLGVVAEVCDDVAVVYAGEIIEYGTKEEVFDNPTHPYTKGLFGAIPDINSHVKRLSPINGLPPDPSDLPKGCSFNPRCKYATEACRNGNIETVNVGGSHICKCCQLDKIRGGEK